MNYRKNNMNSIDKQRGYRLKEQKIYPRLLGAAALATLTLFSLSCAGAPERDPTLNGVAYGDPRFVAIGQRGAILTSADETAWISRGGRSPTLHAIAYGASRFVAVGANGTILSSGDGTRWIERRRNGASLQGLAYVNDTFVAVGAKGTILSSSDGIIWSPRSSGSSQELSAISYGNDTFVAVGAEGTILTSSYGSSWSPQSSGTTQHLTALSYGNGTFVAVGANGTILSSPDGLSWSLQSSGSSQNLRGISYGNDIFVAVGLYGTILNSSDGLSWSRHNTSGHLYGLSYGDGAFVAVGWGGTILTSSDGISWSPRSGDLSFAYSCTNGTAATGSTATRETKCSACDDGYRLTGGESCVALCSENNGTYTLEPTADNGGPPLTLRMVSVPVGAGLNFFTGINNDGDATLDEPYSIAETELTGGVYQRVRDWAVDSERGAARYGFGDVFGSADQPVRINWHDSIKFANALSEYCAATGSTPVYLVGVGGAIMRTGLVTGGALPTVSARATGFRLPTANEWELAARYIRDGNFDGDIKDEGEFYPGNYASGATAPHTDAEATGRVAWYSANSDGSIQPAVGQKRPNALGLYDMSGSEGEWSIDEVPSFPDVAYALGGRHDGDNSFLQIGRRYRNDRDNAIPSVRLVR